MKTINISEENWKQISRMRIDLDCSTMDETISRILKIINKIEDSK